MHNLLEQQRAAMIEQHHACGWSGTVPSGKATGACASCSLVRTRREVQRCQIGGPASYRPERTEPHERVTEPVGTALTALIDGLFAVQSGSGCGCSMLAGKMDGWGLAGCETHREEIVDKLVENRDMLVNAIAAAGWMHGALSWTAGTRLAIKVLRHGAGMLLDKAMENVRSRPKPESVQRTTPPVRQYQGRKSNTHPESGMGLAQRTEHFATKDIKECTEGMQRASEAVQFSRLNRCDGCGHNADGQCLLSQCGVLPKVQAAAAGCLAHKWFPQTTTLAPLVNPTRNLNFHIYPKIGAEWNWHWHIENIRRAAPLFNGRISIGIVTGPGLAPPQEVQRLLSGVPVTDWVIHPNTRLIAETATFVDLLRTVETDDPNTITFRGHTKGATHRKDGVEQEWARLMWASCMDLASVEDALNSHVMAGPLKCQEPLVSHQRYKWFFAGSYYWFRNREVFQRDWSTVEKTRWFVEAWPGMIASNEEAACLIHDFTDGSVLRQDYWREIVRPSFEAWKIARPNRDRGYE